MVFKAEVKFIGDEYPGAYANGLTMVGSATMGGFTEKELRDDYTKLETKEGIYLEIFHKPGKNAGVTVVNTKITNASDSEKTMEMLTSFMIEGIKADKIHRMQSFWSAEGRHKCDNLTDLNMEVSWAKHGTRVLKFGNVGSMPVRSYFPFVALEDSENGHFVAVSLYSPSSWQMELICQKSEEYTLTGGIADRDFGHWTKILKKGEYFEAPKAVVAEGSSLIEVCNLLLKEQSPDISPVDEDMGITFNEYCTTWGDPTIDNLKKIADKLEGKGIKYLVMDSGWYLKKGENWWDHIGKWEVNKDRFPNGLSELTGYIREKGMIPGIWFEPESLAWGSPIYNDTDYILTKDGYPLTIAGKRFLDMESEKTREFLREKVIGLLKGNDFGYIKIDYNDTIGIGCDGDESLGENLRRKILASQDFFKELRREIPKLVIENCSSGGHRLEPSMMGLSSMASFSDAHETLSIPLIAASLQKMVLPSQNQIWAVMRAEDSDERIYYSMASTFLGRMGLSGDIYDLSDHQWALIDEGIDFYNSVSDIIKEGELFIHETDVDSWNNPVGSQFIVRKHGDRYLAVLHRFKDKEQDSFTMPDFLNSFLKVEKEYGSLEKEYSAKAWLLNKVLPRQ